VVKVKRFLGFSDDFFLPHARLNAMEFHLVRAFRGPSFEDPEAKRGERANRSGLLGVVEDFAAGVVFLFHALNVSQMGGKASIFFIFFRARPLPIFENIQTFVLILVGGGVKFQSPHHLF
jgi:hypothetical protein